MGFECFYVCRLLFFVLLDCLAVVVYLVCARAGTVCLAARRCPGVSVCTVCTVCTSVSRRDVSATLATPVKINDGPRCISNSFFNESFCFNSSQLNLTEILTDFGNYFWPSQWTEKFAKNIFAQNTASAVDLYFCEFLI